MYVCTVYVCMYISIHVYVRTYTCVDKFTTDIHRAQLHMCIATYECI